MGGASTTHYNLAATAVAKTAISSAGCTGVSTPAQVIATTTRIQAADFLSFCATTLASTTAVVSIVDTVANQKIGDYTFTSVALCA